jgi:hypothetical protein
MDRGKQMDDSPPERLRQVWQQTTVPVLFRKGKGYPLMVKLPFAEDNRSWLRAARTRRPEWNGTFKCWETPKAWFSDLVEAILSKYGKLYIIQPYRPQEICAPACWNAVGHECQCSCMGENHGMSAPSGKWLVISDTFATSWGERALACRLMTRKAP